MVKPVPSLLLAVLAAAGALTPEALAGEPPPGRQRLAVTRVRGSASWGAESLQRALTSALAAELDLVEPPAMEAAQRSTTGRSGQPARFSPEGLASAGRAAGATHVLTVEITRKGYLFSAHAELVSTSSAAVVMDFRAGYYRPASDAADRGLRIARTTLGKLRRLAAPSAGGLAGSPGGPGPREARGREPSPDLSPGGLAGWPRGPGPREARTTQTATSATSATGRAREDTDPRDGTLADGAGPGGGGGGGRDDDIFGDADIGEPSTGGARDDEIFGSGLGGPGGVEETERRLSELETKVRGGGRVFMRLNYLVTDSDVGETSRLSSPNLLDLYVDARLSDRVRAYAQARVNHDFTVAEGVPDTFGATQTETKLLLDQLWLKFDVAHALFVTVGRQRIKWGTGRFWNPTDFLNAAQRDPLAVFDERLGVSLAKLHLPIELLSWNFYAIATFDDADLAKRIGGALRAELVLGPAELTLSAQTRKDGPQRLGADLSAGLSVFDVRAEAAVVRRSDRAFYEGTFDPDTGQLPSRVDRTDEWIPQAVVGAEISVEYSDRSSLIFGLEYFYNGAGYGDETLYPFLLFQDAADRRACSGLECPSPAFQPLYLGKHYGGAYLVLPDPFGLRDNTFILSGLANLSDGSALARLDHQATVLSFLAVSAFVQAHLGHAGELKLGFDVPPVPGVIGLERGLSVPEPVVDVGLGISITF